MTRRRFLRLRGLRTIRFSAFLVRAALFIRAPVLVGFAIGVRLTIGFCLALGLRARRCLVPCSRFRLAAMPLPCLSLVAFRPIAIVTLTRLARRAVARLARFAVCSFTVVTLASLARLTVRSVTGGGLVGFARARRGFLCFTRDGRVPPNRRRRSTRAPVLRAPHAPRGPARRLPCVTLASLLARLRFACRGFLP